MKPWFEKELAEADIIKFPEPEAKVIQMPNVQEYPDFITGAQDLQAKQKDGAISQESYDKLYTELIHRFMKKESFETPWFIREDKTTNIDQKINQLVQVGKQDPKKSDEVSNILNKIIQYGQKILGQEAPKTEQVQPATLDQKNVSAQQILDFICQKLPARCDKPITDVDMFLTKAFKELEKSGVEKGRNELNDFLTKYDNAINALTNKITSSEQAFVDANSYAQGKKMQGEVATKKNTIEVIKGVISSIFTGKLFKAGTITDRQLQDKLLTFLNAAKEGIVSWGKILEAGKGKTAKIDQFVPPEYKEMFEMFRTQLMRARPPTTAGAWGPGEVGLIMLGNPITKAGDSGDLMDVKTGAKFELKGSKESKKGGRLSPEGLSTSKNPKSFKTLKEKHIGAKVLQKHFKDLGNKSYLAGKDSYSVNQRFINQLNDLIDKGLKIDNKAFLTDTIIAAFTHNHPTGKELVPYVKQMVVGNKIDYDKFVKAYAKFLMVRYQGSGKDKKFKGIIVFNPITGSYTVISSYKDLDFKDLDITGGIEFGATQVPKSPQIGIA